MLDGLADITPELVQLTFLRLNVQLGLIELGAIFPGKPDFLLGDFFFPVRGNAGPLRLYLGLLPRCIGRNKHEAGGHKKSTEYGRRKPPALCANGPVSTDIGFSAVEIAHAFEEVLHRRKFVAVSLRPCRVRSGRPPPLLPLIGNFARENVVSFFVL